MRSRTAAVAAIATAAIVVIGVLSAVFIQAAYNTAIAAETSRLSATAQLSATLVAQQLHGVEDLVDETLQQPSFAVAVGDGAVPALQVPQLQSALVTLVAQRGAFRFAAYLDGRGTARATVPAGAAPGALDSARLRDASGVVAQLGRAVVSSGFLAGDKGSPLLVAVTSPVRGPVVRAANGAASAPIVGFVVVAEDVAGLAPDLAAATLSPAVDLQVTDQAGSVLTPATGGARQPAPASIPVVSAALAGRATTSTTSGALAAGAPVSGLGWSVSASTPLSVTAAARDRSTMLIVAAGLLLGLVIAATVAVRITRRIERADERHSANAAELRTVLETLTDAVQVFDAAGTMVSRNPAAEALFEVTERDPTSAAIYELWEPIREDGTPLPRDDGPLARAVRTGVGSEQVVTGVRRIADGAVRWLSVSTSAIVSAPGRVAGYVSCARDITDRVETLRGLRILTEASERLSATLVRAEVIAALTEAARDVCSRPGEEPRRAVLLVVDGDELVMTGVNDALAGADVADGRFSIADHPYARRVLASGEPLVTELSADDFGPSAADLVRRVGLRNGALVPVTRGERVVAVLAVSGRQHALVDASQLAHLTTLVTIGALALSNAEAHQRAEDLARTDPLTGVGNRRALDERLRQLPRTRFAIAAIDVDHLKAVNDAHGHDAGDLLLHRVATAVRTELRPSDVLARTGGDEFAALLVDSDAGGAAEFGARARAAVAGVRLPWGAPSISVGVAAGRAGEDPRAVAKAADLALYAAKQARSPRGTEGTPVAAGR